jgi:hypothetical protein
VKFLRFNCIRTIRDITVDELGICSHGLICHKEWRPPCLKWGELSILVVALATGTNSQVGSGIGSTRNWTVATGLTTRKTRTVGNGAVWPPKTRHFKSTIFSPIKYLSSDRIMTWSVRKLSSFSPSFTSCIQICDQTNKRRGGIENPRNSLKNRRYFTATQRISVRSQIWIREVKEWLKLHNVHTDHVMIRWELIYLIGAKAV